MHIAVTGMADDQHRHIVFFADFDKLFHCGWHEAAGHCGIFSKFAGRNLTEGFGYRPAGHPEVFRFFCGLGNLYFYSTAFATDLADLGGIFLYRGGYTVHFDD